MKKTAAFLLVLICSTNTNHAQQTQFGSISATVSNCIVSLSFNTITEFATDLMRIERSRDGGISYIQIGTIAGHQPANGLPGSGYSYTYTDNNPFSAGTSTTQSYRYRVRTNKYDQTYGPFVYSSSFALSIFPCGSTGGNTLCGASNLMFGGYVLLPGYNGATNVCATPTMPITVLGVTNSQTIVWTSSNPAVATVNAYGFLVPVSVGTTYISASLPACGLSVPPLRFDICTCSSPVVPNQLGGNWGQGACQLYFNRVPGITTYKLEWVNLLTNASGSKTITYTGATYAFTDLPYGTPFKYRVAASTTSPCTSYFSAWYNVLQSSACGTGLPANLVASSVCGTILNCGYERFNWTALANNFTHEVVYEIYRLTPGPAVYLPLQSFIVNSQPPTVQPIPNYTSLTGGGWMIRFKVRGQCVSGVWGPFTAMSSGNPL